MAIIRKGDKKAEKELADRAYSMRDYGAAISPGTQAARTRKRKAAQNVVIDPKTKQATDLSRRYNRRPYTGGGISGAALDYVKRQRTTVKSAPHLFSGVIEKGQIVKGGNGPLQRSLDNKKVVRDRANDPKRKMGN